MEKNCSKDFSTWERAENTAETLFGNIWNITGKNRAQLQFQQPTKSAKNLKLLSVMLLINPSLEPGLFTRFHSSYLPGTGKAQFKGQERYKEETLSRLIEDLGKVASLA